MEKKKRKAKNEAIRNCAYIFNNKTKIPTCQMGIKPSNSPKKQRKLTRCTKNLRNICKINFPYIGKIPCDVFYNLKR